MIADGPSGWVEYDFPGVRIGTAEHSQGTTGVTVISLPPGARAAVDAPGSVLGLSHASPCPPAICLAGGGLAGLAAAVGVADALSSQAARGQSPEQRGQRGAVSVAAIDDFAVRAERVVPDAALGRAATLAAEPGRAKYGRVGAGAAASVGAVGADDSHSAEFAGQGVAFREVGALKVLVVTVVSGLGVIIDRKGTVVRGNVNRMTGARRHPVADYAQRLFGGAVPDLDGGGGTLTVAITNAQLGDHELAAFARQVHASMARAISPFLTGADADVLFAVATNELDLGGPSGQRWAATASAVGAIASEAAWDAVLRSCPQG